MAALRVAAETNRTYLPVTRLGGQWARVRADTWHTFSEIKLSKDGSGSFAVTRDGEIVAQAEWGKE